jgi:hypothetical protein
VGDAESGVGAGGTVVGDDDGGARVGDGHHRCTARR